MPTSRLDLLRWTPSSADSPLCCPVANSFSCSGVRSRLPLSVVPRQLPVSSFLQPTLFRVPLPLPDTARFQVQKPFVWFRAKTDKGIVCLVGHLYSVTPILITSTDVCYLSEIACSLREFFETSSGIIRIFIFYTTIVLVASTALWLCSIS